MSVSASLDLKNICKIQSTRLPLKVVFSFFSDFTDSVQYFGVLMLES